MQLSPSIFKAYDIRGIIDETLDPSIAKLIGQAFGTEMRELGETEIVIGRDGRLSGPSLIEALTEGLLSTGINVIDLGMVATPMVYFGANQTLNGKKPKSGIMITGSHNPPNYNGFKMVLGGAAIYGDQIQALRKRIEAQKFATGQGTRTTFDIFPMYLERIVSDRAAASCLWGARGRRTAVRQRLGGSWRVWLAGKQVRGPPDARMDCRQASWAPVGVAATARARLGPSTPLTGIWIVC